MRFRDPHGYGHGGPYASAISAKQRASDGAQASKYEVKLQILAFCCLAKRAVCHVAALLSVEHRVYVE